MEHDSIRQEDIVLLGIKVIRFTNSEIRLNIDRVINKIRGTIKALKVNGNSKEKSN
jgi:very-short-patch-repair endonuclease